MAWGRLTDFVKRGMGLDFNSALFFVFSQNEIQTRVIELNTDGQLFDRGIDAEGVALADIGGEYAERTVQIKREDSLPFDRVTLFQEGEFYDSFSVKPEKDGILIEADTLKEGDEDLRDRWGDKILGLTDDSIEILNEEIVEIIVRYIYRELLQ
jgi:hypothetical protein